MDCAFPGEELAQFPQVQALYLGYNDFEADFGDVAESLAPLNATLRELNLFGNTKISGALAKDNSSGACLLAAVRPHSSFLALSTASLDPRVWGPSACLWVAVRRGC